MMFYDNLLKELQKVLCGGSEYEDQRKQLRVASDAGKMVFVAMISQAISPHVGASAVIIGPAVALTLAVIGRTGVLTLCEGLSQILIERESASATGQPLPADSDTP